MLSTLMGPMIGGAARRGRNRLSMIPRTTTRTVLCLALLTPFAQGWAQVDVSPRLEVGLLAGVTVGTPRAFDPNPCPRETARDPGATGRASLRLVGSLRVEGGVDIVGGPTGPICQLDAPIPPQNGEFVVSYYPARHVGYPVVQTGVRAVWTVVRGDAAEVRLTGGMERAWARGLWVPAAGVAVPIGRGGLRGLLELESLWFAIPRVTRTTLFQNGAPVSSTETETTVRTRSTRIRAGVLLPIP